MHDTKQTRPHRSYQYSMATLLILTTALCVWLALNREKGALEVGLSLLFLAPVILGWWKMFEKAGYPGWGAVVPIYNLLLLLRVARRPTWWIILCVIPLFNLIPLVLVPLSIAKHFGQNVLFGVGLIFFGFILYPVLGFGSAQYLRPTYVRFHDGEPYVC